MMLHKLLLAIYNLLPLPAGLKTRLLMAIRKTKVKVNVLLLRISSFWQRKVARKVSRAVYAMKQRVLDYPNERELFFNNHGYPLDLKNPHSFNEKIIWRKIYDRNPLFPRVTDKYLVRDYVREILGAQRADEILIPILFYGKDPAAIPFDDLPDQFVIKPSHASGRIILVRNKHEIDRKTVIATCKDWVSDTYGFYRHEWAYQKLKPMILVEPLLLDEDNNVPREVKFHVFHGKCKRIVVIAGRYSDLKQSNFDENWNYLETQSSYPMGPPSPNPPICPRCFDWRKNWRKISITSVLTYMTCVVTSTLANSLFTPTPVISTTNPPNMISILGRIGRSFQAIGRKSPTSPNIKPGHRYI